MAIKNRYYYRSHFSERKFRQILRYFALDLTASDCARLTAISVRSCNCIYLKIRKRLAHAGALNNPICGELELDESYFGPRRVPGKRGRGASCKTIVFGILQRHGHVYTQIIPNTTRSVLRRAIRGSVDRHSIIHSDGLSGYDGLVDMGYAKHFRVFHGRGEYVRGDQHINGIESFWSYAKRRMSKFNGVPAETFYLHLKETEFRFNHRDQDLARLLMKMLRENPLK